MKSRHMTILAVVSALTLVLALFAGFVISPLLRPPTPPFVLPEDDSDLPSSDTPISSQTLFPYPSASPREKLTVTPDNIQQALADMARPTAYSATYTVTLYWSRGSNQWYFRTCTLEGVVKSERLDINGRVLQTRVMGNGEYYYDWPWEAKAGQGFAPDNMSFLPVYEDELQRVLNADSSDISDAAYEVWESRPSLRLTLTDKTTDHHYTFDAESGLLLSYEKVQYGQTTYTCRIESWDLAAPDRAEFDLPNGQSAILQG